MASSYLHCNNHIFWQADLTRTYMPPKRVRDGTRKHGVRNGLELKKMDSGYLSGFNVPYGLPAYEPRRSSITPELAATKTPKIEEESSQHPSESLSKSLSILTKASRLSSRTPPPDLKAKPLQILKFLLSDDALEICHPPASPEPDNSNLRTYAQLLTPYEELLCAVILSQPLPYRLNIHTIETLLNPPYEFRNPVAVKTAGPKKVLEALETARAQYPETSHVDIAGLADAISNNQWHNDISKLRALKKGAPESEREALRRKIKGLGEGGLDVFFRRVQWQWTDMYPFIDARTQLAVGKLGLPRRAEGLEKMIEVRWGKVGFEDWSTEFDLEQRRRRAFVVVLERVIGSEAEGRVEELVEGAAKL
jgi:hypothetical protein